MVTSIVTAIEQWQHRSQMLTSLHSLVYNSMGTTVYNTSITTTVEPSVTVNDTLSLNSIALPTTTGNTLSTVPDIVSPKTQTHMSVSRNVAAAVLLALLQTPTLFVTLVAAVVSVPLSIHYSVDVNTMGTLGGFTLIGWYDVILLWRWGCLCQKDCFCQLKCFSVFLEPNFHVTG